MKEHLIILILSSIIFGGCLQTRENLAINKDGSGTFEAGLKVPSATLDLIDSTLGELIKNMQAAFGGKAEKSPDSIAEEMFGSRDEIAKKAKNAGLNIEFISFSKERKNDGLYVNYKFRFDDVSRMIESDIVGMKLELSKNTRGDLVLTLKGDPQKADESEKQKKQFMDWQDSEDSKKMPPEVKKQLFDAFRNFKYDFLVSLPGEIKTLSGLFSKVNATTASISFSGDILEDPSLIDKIYGLRSEPSVIVSSGEDVILNKGSGPSNSPKP